MYLWIKDANEFKIYTHLLVIYIYDIYEVILFDRTIIYFEKFTQHINSHVTLIIMLYISTLVLNDRYKQNKVKFCSIIVHLRFILNSDYRILSLTILK